MTLTNQELKKVAFDALNPISVIEMIDIDEVWKLEGDHYRDLTVWEEGHEITASIKVYDSFTADQVMCLLMAEVDYLEEYFLNQNK